MSSNKKTLQLKPKEWSLQTAPREGSRYNAEVENSREAQSKPGL